MQDATREALVGRLSIYEEVVEVGVGRRPEVAAGLADAGVAVTATDVRERSVPEGVRFVHDDVTDPTHQFYAGADAIYGLNLPAELQQPARELAREVGTPLLLTTLGAEQPVVPAEPEQLPGETLYTVESERP